MIGERAGERRADDGRGPRPAPGRGGALAAVLAVAATYGYFLLFAELALLALAQASLGDAGLRPLLALLGATGVAGGGLAAARFRPGSFRGALAGGFAGCAVAAVVAVVAGRPGIWFAAAGTGLSLGWTTVTLSAGLRAVAGAGRLGLWCGLGTGLAYAASNLPVVFEAAARSQAGIAVGFAFAGLVAVGLMQPGWPAGAPEPERNKGGWLCWGTIFLALVWLDAAGFYVLQHTPRLRALTWSGSAALYGNAFTHLAGAALAGWALDAGRAGGTALVAVLFLAVADGLLGLGNAGPAGAQVLYTLGVSAYSVALVYYPAFGARPWVAAGIFSVAGWLGSALGIGMVQNLHAIPVWFIGLAAGVVVTALAIRRRRPPGAGWLALVALLGCGARPARAEEAAAVVARGREVYIAEGCINCHSQYVRPGVPADVLRWGPARPLAQVLAETPPLVGLRRQGPDLMNVGNRRSAEWQRLHLIAPGALAPGSRMPAYAHLFRDGDLRGDSLVAYLMELGADTMPERWEMIAGWKPAPALLRAPVVPGGGRREFQRLCASCHGADGRGDGPVAPRLFLKPPDFSRDGWRHLRPDEPEPLITVARLIKFGVPGTAMAGHEYLDDTVVVALTRYVIDLHRAAESGSAAPGR